MAADNRLIDSRRTNVLGQVQKAEDGLEVRIKAGPTDVGTPRASAHLKQSPLGGSLHFVIVSQFRDRERERLSSLAIRDNLKHI